MYLTIRVTASDTGYYYKEKIKIEKEFASGEIGSEELDEDVIELFSRIASKKTKLVILEYLEEDKKLKAEDGQQPESE